MSAGRSYIRDASNFPRPGIIFRGIMPMLRDAKAFAECIEKLAASLREHAFVLRFRFIKHSYKKYI
jgi:adenine/guanine phosphoribosyltransferase-like PRPP-binding protein